MMVKVKIEFNLKNGTTKEVVVGEKDPKGILRDKTTGDEREIDLTEREVMMEYTKKIAANIEKEETLYFIGMDQTILMVNPTEIASTNISAVTTEVKLIEGEGK